MSINPILNTRRVAQDTKPVYAFACGINFCGKGDDTTHVFDAVLMSRKEATDGLPVYAAAQDCCAYPLTLTAAWVQTDCWPLYGISSDINVLLQNDNLCTPTGCIAFNASYNSMTQHWTGSVVYNTDASPITLTIDIQCVSAVIDGVFTYGLSVILGGCVSPTVTLSPIIDCIYPLRAHLVVDSSVVTTADLNACCMCSAGALSSFNLFLRGYCARIYQARQIDVYMGVPVYATGYQCCEPCPIVVCCGLTPDSVLTGIVVIHCSGHPDLTVNFTMTYFYVLGVGPSWIGTTTVDCPSANVMTLQAICTEPAQPCGWQVILGCSGNPGIAAGESEQLNCNGGELYLAGIIDNTETDCCCSLGLIANYLITSN